MAGRWQEGGRKVAGRWQEGGRKMAGCTAIIDARINKEYLSRPTDPIVPKQINITLQAGIVPWRNKEKHRPGFSLPICVQSVDCPGGELITKMIPL